MFKHLIEFMKPHKKWFIIAPLAKLLEAIFELLLPTLMVLIVNVGIANNDPAYIMKIGLTMFAFAVAGLICSIICQFYASRVSQGVGTAMRDALFAKILRFSREDIESFGASTLINRTTNDVTQIQTGIAMLIRLVIRAPFLCIGSLIMSFILNWRLALLILAVLPVFSAILYLILKKSLPLYNIVQKKLDKLGLILRENLSGVRVIRAFAHVDSEKARYQQANDEYRDNFIKVGKISALTGPMTSFAVNMLVGIILYFAGNQVFAGLIQSGEIIAFVNYVVQIMLQLIVISQLVILFSKAFISLKRVNEVFDRRPSLADEPHIPVKEASSKPDGVEQRELKKNAEAALHSSDELIEFNQVGFEYPDSSEKAIKDINFKIKKGWRVGIIGATGSGKTTLIKLLMRDYDVTQGEILVEHQNVKQYSLGTLKRLIGVAPQKAALFSFSVRENIRMGNPEATDEQVKQAARIAQAADFIEKMPGGYDYVISRGSTNVSGGQKQRLSIARAIVRNPEILILDDSTSALDFATAAALNKALQEHQRETTVISVSQRVSAVRACDMILVMSEGKIVGRGTHDSLLLNCEEYKEICASQDEQSKKEAI